jgi:hypothetical protein
MNDDANKSPSTMLAVGGGGFLVLAGYFLVRDLALPPEIMLTSEPYFGLIAFRIPIPAGTVDGDSVQLRFREPLDGARVEAFGQGPRTSATLLRKRIGGDTVVVPLAPGRVDAVDVRVHRNFRPPPIVRDAAVLVPAPNRRE